MKKPVDGLIDARAPYVALSRATALEKLYMVEPITLDQLRHKPKPDIAATLDFLDRLDKATQDAFLGNPSVFTPVTVRSLGKGHDRNQRRGRNGRMGSGSAPGDRCGPFLAPNSRQNCFFNASIACTLAAYDGQPLLPPQSSTPSAKRFFAAIGAVHEQMEGGHALPPDVLVRLLISLHCFRSIPSSRVMARFF